VNLTLLRDAADATATLGTLLVSSGSMALQTLELPWVPALTVVVDCGKQGLSCVPAGTYQLALHDTLAHPRSFALVNPELGVYHEPGDVPAGVAAVRVAILIHVANYPSDLEGCIGVGMARHGPPWMISNSSDAYSIFKTTVPWIEGHTLTIAYNPGVTP
jgi:hypothetical protein